VDSFVLNFGVYYFHNTLSSTEFIDITRTESKKIIEKVRMVKQALTVALVKVVLQVLDRMGLT
jgi:hypothetical protein